MKTYVRPTIVNVPFKNINNDVDSMVPWPILPPHRVLSMMFKTGLMSKLMLGGIDLRRYWEVFALEHPDHPGVLLARSGVLPIPVRLHGDEGQIQRKEKLMLFSFCGFFHGAVLDSRFVSAVFPSRHYVYDSQKVCQSLVSLHRFLVWSLNWCAKGMWPTEPYPDTKFDQYEEDRAGTPLGFNAFVTAFKGDWQYEYQSLQQSRSWQHSLRLIYLSNAFL